MAPAHSARQTFTFLRRTLWLFPIPLLWIAFSLWDLLQPIEVLTEDMRYRGRGSIESPVNLFYVNRDQLTTQVFGNEPFPRELYAKVARAVLELGRARAVFFDFVFSPYAITRAMPPDYVLEQDLKLAAASRQFGNRMVMAAAYTAVRLSVSNVASRIPLLYQMPDKGEAFDPAEAIYPETPTYPVWSLPHRSQNRMRPGWGRVGLINIDVRRSSGAAPRWIPAWVEVENEFHAANFVNGFVRWTQLQHGDEVDLIHQQEGDLFVLRMDGEPVLSLPAVQFHRFFTAAVEILCAAHGLDSQVAVERTDQALEIRDFLDGDRLLYRIPLTDRQMVEINWFSPWVSRPPLVSGQPVPPEDLAKAIDTLLRTRRAAMADPGGWAAEPNAALEEALNLLTAVEHDRHNPQVSIVLVDVMAELHDLAPPSLQEQILRWFERFQDTIVLCGPTDEILQDVAPTPIDPGAVPRVSAHGNLIKTIVSGRYIKRFPWSWEVAITLLLTLAFAHCAMHSGRSSRLMKGLAVLVLVGYLGTVYWLFCTADQMWPVVAPVGSAVSTALVGLVIQLVLEEKAKSRIKGMFGTYVAPELVEQMIESGEDPQLGGRELEITAFFSDVESFSSFSEILTPTQLVELMNEYLGAMTEILHSGKGTLDKYIGDAVVAMFGAPVPLPDHASRACRVSLLMHQRVVELRNRWAASPEVWPERVHRMRVRIGLNSGLAVVGNMGSETRFNYTMMGDTVNLAARSESGAKSYGVFTMVSGETKAAAEAQSPDFVFRYLDRIVVKGRSQPVDMYELVDFRDRLSEQDRECLALYETGVKHYLARRWDEAEESFSRSATLERFQPGRDAGVKDNPSTVMIERAEEMRANPPPDDWTGVYVMKSK